MRKSDPVRTWRGRHARRVAALARVLDTAPQGELVIRPWQYRLPRLVVLAAAQARGYRPVGGLPALRERVSWTEPMRLTSGDVEAGG